jgi:signal transduction histidine kinase
MTGPAAGGDGPGEGAPRALLGSWLRRGGLWIQLLAGSVAVVAVTFSALALLLWVFFSRHFAAGRLDTLVLRAAEVARLFAHRARAALPRTGSLVKATGGTLWVVGAHGAVLRRYPHGRGGLGSLGIWIRAGQRAAVLAGRPLAEIAPGHGGSGAMAVVGTPVGTAGRALLGARAIFWLAPVGGGALVRAVGARVALAAAAGLVLAGALFAWLAERVARPVRALEAAAVGIAAGRFDVEVPRSGPAEVRSLAVSLAEMARRLGEADRRRRDFLADVSHELRSPLTALRGALEALRGGVPSPAASARALDLALGETARLSRLLDDLLALARLNLGRFPLEPQPVDLWETVLRVALSLEPTAALRRVQLRFTGPGRPAWVNADPDRLRQVLWNLLHNAARHAPAGAEVTVAGELEGARVVVRIANPGPPIPAERVPLLFERFERGGGEGEPGTGLGLAIARALAEAHGATLDAVSPPAGGLVVTLSWPRLPSRRPPVAPRPPGTAEGSEDPGGAGAEAEGDAPRDAGGGGV